LGAGREQTACFLSAEPVLSLQQVKAKVFDDVLANLGLFLHPIKEREGGESLSYSWSSQQVVIYILEECAAMLVS
jgi:hypothetical protein